MLLMIIPIRKTDDRMTPLDDDGDDYYYEYDYDYDYDDDDDVDENNYYAGCVTDNENIDGNNVTIILQIMTIVDGH